MTHCLAPTSAPSPGTRQPTPFRAGIRLDAYQLLPLRKALHLPRVNLLIADDVGLGKTIEAGQILRELLLRRRIDFVLVAAPPSMTVQWQDELEAKFGLRFEILDRERLSEIRRIHGFAATHGQPDPVSSSRIGC
jgi:SNF2 family DNA or RNA helicase